MDKKPSDICSDYSISIETELEELKESILAVSGLSEVFKALADETRTAILHLLSQKELCVCDLGLILDISLPAVSHHLRLLRMMRLVKSRREGKQVYYRLDDNHVVELISVAAEHFQEMGENNEQ